ncbi:hypothetical protein DFH29DRAFT_1024186 [Suillus ampliporus]|nr:hypothetical protein DFH29DRAFT_1024186 [Suillus ampliporus]
MPNHQLPANAWLGYTLNLSTTTTMDINAATHAVMKARRIINYKTDEIGRPFEIEGHVYDVPTAVTIVDDVRSSQSDYRYYPTGTKASTDFREDTSLGIRYFAVQSDSSCSERSLTKTNQYAFFSFTRIVYGAHLQDYADLLNKPALVKGVATLTSPFSGTDPDILKGYKSFFQRYGSHVIVGGNYGARFQMNVWASNKTDAVNDKFAADVVAAFDGIPHGGQFDNDLTKETQYKTFLEYMQKLVSVSGGDAKLALAVATNPSSNATYTRWLDSVTETPHSTVLSFQTVELWTLMRYSTDKKLKDFADQLEAAFAYILANPKRYKTTVVFDIQSNWAEFNLLTPSADVELDPEHLYPSNTVASNTRVKWSVMHPDKQTLRFFILNDGSPIDFSISHGSEGDSGGNGMAEVMIERIPYKSEGTTDNIWNTRWFHGAPVSEVPEPSV